MFKYCDCRDNRGTLDLRKAKNGHNKMRYTNTDKEGKCVYCMHFALISKDILKVTRSGLQCKGSDVGVKKYFKEYNEQI